MTSQRLPRYQDIRCENVRGAKVDGKKSTVFYAFCIDHQSTFGSDDHIQCHAVRMAQAVHGIADPPMTPQDFAATGYDNWESARRRAVRNAGN